jgi:hypothetical protein
MTRLVTIDADHPGVQYLVKQWVPIYSGLSDRSTAATAVYLRDQIAAQTRIPEPGLWGVVSARLTEECQAENRKGPLAGDFIHCTDGSWRNADTGFGVTWLELDNPVLVREGVQS